MIDKYFFSIENNITFYQEIISSIVIDKKKYSNSLGYINIDIVFNDKSCLFITEVKDVYKTGKNKYRYHYMDKYDELIFRYDNVQHYRKMKTFPHHKHLKNEVIESEEPQLNDVLLEVYKIIIED